MGRAQDIQVTFTDPRLARGCNDNRLGQKRFGAEWPLIRRRLKQLEAAASLADMQLGNPHQLTRDLAGRWAVSTSRNDRILFAIDHDPQPLLADGSIDQKAVTAIAVSEVSFDYH